MLIPGIMFTFSENIFQKLVIFNFDEFEFFAETMILNKSYRMIEIYQLSSKRNIMWYNVVVAYTKSIRHFF